MGTYPGGLDPKAKPLEVLIEKTLNYENFTRILKK